MKQMTIAVQLKDGSLETGRTFNPFQAGVIEAFHEECAGGKVSFTDSLLLGYRISCASCGESLVILGEPGLKSAIRCVIIKGEEKEMRVEDGVLLKKIVTLRLIPQK